MCFYLFFKLFTLAHKERKKKIWHWGIIYKFEREEKEDFITIYKFYKFSKKYLYFFYIKKIKIINKKMLEARECECERERKKEQIKWVFFWMQTKNLNE